MLVLLTRSEKETQNLGARIGKIIFAPSCIALIGELGSGKTTLTRGIARGLGVESTVKSPSFVIINEYPGPVPVYHFDLYRIDNPDQLVKLGYEEYFYSRRGVVVVEWADKILDFLPSQHLRIEMRIKNLHEREIFFLPVGKSYSKVVEKIKGETS